MQARVQMEATLCTRFGLEYATMDKKENVRG